MQLMFFFKCRVAVGSHLNQPLKQPQMDGSLQPVRSFNFHNGTGVRALVRMGDGTWKWYGTW